MSNLPLSIAAMVTATLLANAVSAGAPLQTPVVPAGVTPRQKALASPDWMTTAAQGGAQSSPRADSVIDPIWFGADPSGQRFSDEAVAKAIAASSHVRFGPGRYRFARPVAVHTAAGSSVFIEGQGSGISNLQWSSGSDGIVFTLDDGQTSSVHLRDLTIASCSEKQGRGVTIENGNEDLDAARGLHSDLTNVEFRGCDGPGSPGVVNSDAWSSAIETSNVSNIDYNSLSISGTNNADTDGIVIHGRNERSYSVAHNISYLFCTRMRTCIKLGSYVQGVTVTQPNMTLVQYGINAPRDSKGVLSQLVVVGGQCLAGVNGRGHAVLLEVPVEPVQIDGLLALGNGVVAIKMTTHTFGYISHVVCDFGTRPTGGIFEGSGCIDLAEGASDFLIDHILVHNAAFGIRVWKSANVHTDHNVFRNVARPLIDDGSAGLMIEDKE